MLRDYEQADGESGGVTVSSRMFGLLMLGFLLVFAGLIVVVAAAVLGNTGSGSLGGVIFVGPIPIVFGVGPDSNWLIIISIIIALVMATFYVIYLRRARKIYS